MRQVTLDLFADADSTADFSEDGVYRYRLERWWDRSLPPLVVCMLNPSKADAKRSDPTVTRMIRFARDAGYGGLIVVNLFALVSTDPRALRAHDDPIGNPRNDEAIESAATIPGACVVAAWGAHPFAEPRAICVDWYLSNLGVRLHVFRLTKHGHPAHPLYLPASLRPVVWGATPSPTPASRPSAPSTAGARRPG